MAADPANGIIRPAVLPDLARGERPARASLVRGLACVALFLGWGVCAAQAHPAYLTVAQAVVGPDGSVQVDMQFDTLAFALNDTSARIGNPPMEALLDGPRAELEAALAEAKDRFAHGFVITTDQGPLTPTSIHFPGAAEVLAWKETTVPVLPVVLPVRVTGQLPHGAASVKFRFPTLFDQVVLTLERPGEEEVSELVETGADSQAWPLRLTSAATVPTGLEAAGPGPWSTVGRYVKMGFRHILPDGLDHILFVLGLVLLSTRFGVLLAQVTAFTAAHSITLGLSLYGVMRLPATIVEPLIALSIAVVAVENLRTSQLSASRIFVVFGFGLIHGLGFAAALNELGLPRRDFFKALLGFNVGVEFGQIAVVAFVYPILDLLRSWPRYRQAIVYPCSVGIAAIALYWTFERLFAGKLS